MSLPTINLLKSQCKPLHSLQKEDIGNLYLSMIFVSHFLTHSNFLLRVFLFCLLLLFIFIITLLLLFLLHDTWWFKIKIGSTFSLLPIFKIVMNNWKAAWVLSCTHYDNQSTSVYTSQTVQYLNLIHWLTGKCQVLSLLTGNLEEWRFRGKIVTVNWKAIPNELLGVNSWDSMFNEWILHKNLVELQYWPWILQIHKKSSCK